MISADALALALALALSGSLHSRAYRGYRRLHGQAVPRLLRRGLPLEVLRAPRRPAVSFGRDALALGPQLVRDWRIPEGSSPDLHGLAADVLREWAAREVMDS